MKKSNNNLSGEMTFTDFFDDPPITTSLLIVGLVALILAILDFSRAVSY
jgi:hypothetical protein